MNLTDPQQRAAAVDQVLTAAPVVPVMAIEHLEDALPLANALIAGGLPVLEITLRTDCALAAMTRIAAECPQAIVGAGTILDAEQLEAVTRAGARFAISPGATARIYAAAAAATIPLIPAVATASELMTGLEHGHRRFKFFPAEAAGGIPMLKSFAGPFADVRFCPTGGITPANAPAYLALPNVITVGGSWMVPGDAIRAKNWSRIEALARESAALRQPSAR